MTTGDLKNNLRKFHAELKLINYANELDIEGFGSGKPRAFLPILHHVMTEFSIELAQYFYSKDYELQGKNDKNFVSVVYRILRDEFNSKPPLTKEQFFTLGFAERKLQFVTSVIQLCRKKSDGLKPKKRKNLLGSNAAKTSKMNIHIPVETVGNKTGTTSLDNTAVVAMPMEYSPALYLSQSEFDNAVIASSKQATGTSKSGKCLKYIPDNYLSEGQTLRDDVVMAVPGNGSMMNGQDDMPKYLHPGHYVEKTICSSLVQSRPETLTSMNHGDMNNDKDEVPRYFQGSCVEQTICSSSIQSRSKGGMNPSQKGSNWDSTCRDYVSDGSKHGHAAKENICPNVGNKLIKDGINAQPDQGHGIILSPIPLSSRMAGCFDAQSEKQMRENGTRNIPFVNYHRSPEYSRHIFVAQPNDGMQNPARNEPLDVSLLDKHSQEFAELLVFVKEQEKRMTVLEKEAEERNSRIEELVETNSKLNARVMLLETAVALMEEKLE